MRPLKGWWTVIIGVVIAGLGSIQAADLATVVSEQYVGIVMTAIGAVIILLRSVTNTPVGDSEPLK